MKAYVNGNRIEIEDITAEEGRALLGALRAAAADYKRRAKLAQSAAGYCLGKPRRKAPEMKIRAAELEAEAAGLRSLSYEAARLARLLVGAVGSKDVR